MSSAVGARVSRRTAVLSVAALGAALLGVGAAPWLRIPVSTAISDDVAVVVGSDAVPAVRAAGLVLLAAGLALALAGRVARVAAAVAIAVVGLLLVLGVAGFLADPGPAAVAAVAEVTGVRPAGVAPTLTGWPVVALVLGAAASAAGLVVLVAARRWSTGASRYDREVAEVRGGEDAGQGAGASDPTRWPDPMADWDALSRGEDPS